MDEERLNKDKLYLALTRPAMIPGLGIPMEAFVSSVAVGGLAMIVGDSIFYIVLTVPLLVISHMIVKRDQNAFRVLFKFFDTGAKCRNRSHWGGSSTSPLRLKRTYKVEEID